MRIKSAMKTQLMPAFELDIDLYPSPEVRLLYAIVIRALKDLTGTQADAFAALGYLRSKSHKNWSYIWVCREAGLDPDFLQNKTDSELMIISQSLYNRC